MTPESNKELDTQIEQILDEHLYLREHANCSNDCSKKWAENNAVTAVVAHINSLIAQQTRQARKEAVEQFIKRLTLGANEPFKVVLKRQGEEFLAELNKEDAQ